MVRHGYLTDLHVFLLASKGKVQRLGWFHADIWEAWAFWTEHMTSVTVVKSPSFALPASKLSSIYRNLKSNDSDLLYNLPPCSLSAASNPFYFWTSRASAKADFKAQWSLGPLELLCQSMRGSMCPCRWELCGIWQRSKSLEPILLAYVSIFLIAI